MALKHCQSLEKQTRISYLSASASAKLITHNCNTGLLLKFKYFQKPSIINDSCWSSRPWSFDLSVWKFGWRHNIIETRMDHLDLHGGDELFLAHYPVSRLVFLLNMASCHFGYFWAINHPFSGPPSHRCMAQWPKNGLKPWPHMGQGCSGWKGSQSEHNCVTDSKKSEKTCQKWPKIAQTMAIFRHKWLIVWRKKIIFINV